MVVKSFGCSFTHGTDLPDDAQGRLFVPPSKFTWPALIAQKLDCQHKCFAQPGVGNLYILNQILTQSAQESNSVYVINWTWIDRFDFVDQTHRWNSIVPAEQSNLAHVYFRDLHHQFRDKLTNLIYIRTAIDTLKQKNIPFFMTYMDELLFERDHHCNPAISDLQDYVRPYLHNYNGSNFLDWSRQQGFKISDTAHPLEEAHRAAADHWLPQIQSLV